MKNVDWQLCFGPVSGVAGTTTTITAQPEYQYLFRNGIVVASEESAKGTRIVQVLVGEKLQRPKSESSSQNGFTLADFFGSFRETTEHIVFDDVRLDDCQKNSEISITVSFIEPCTFNMIMFGTLMVEE